ncbi:MAG: ROK family protein [Candidatus Rokubacteria bacterium]|nr:ROK family protein [Candidatus Rokubacteria bacterium]MBI3104282.1 ROK family protein [Candidatus Rokubacteria bacterium]
MTPTRAVIGVDVGGTTTAAGLVGADGGVLAHLQAATHGSGPGGALANLLDLIEGLATLAKGRGIEPRAIGIGVPGTVDAETGIIGAEAHYVPDLAHVPLAAVVRERTGLPVFVDNDVNALALGEWMFGAGRGAASLVLLALGTGVGGGIILEGRLVRGRGGYGGELGHVPIDFDGRPCICGGRGCLKTYCSGTDIALEGSRRLGRMVTAPEVFRLAAAGDAVAEALVAEVCEALGAGLAVIVNGLNPERLLLAGGVAKSLRPLETRIRAACARHAFAGACATTAMEIISLDKGAAVRGGAALARYETRRREGATV